LNIFQRNYWNLLIKSELVRNSALLISGTVIAQIIPILLRPVLSRLYSPEVFGAYSVYLSIAGILIIVSSFKYEQAIVLPRNDKHSANVLFLALIINLIFNLTIFLLILLFKDSILKLIKLPLNYSFFLNFIPLGTFLYGIYQSINYWLIRRKAFFQISVNKFARRGTEGITQVGFAFAALPGGLLIGDLIGNLSNVVLGIIQGFKNGLSFELLSLHKLRFVAKRYSDFPKYNLIPGLMSACSFLLPNIFINKYFSSEYAGYFDTSKMLLSIPLALIATSLSSVLLQRISEKYRNSESLKKDIYPIIVLVLIVIIFEVLLITFFGIEIFTLIFGKNWLFSGTISKILVWAYATNFFISTFSSIFISLNRIKLLSIWQLLYFVGIMSLVFFKNHSFIDFIKIYVIIEIFFSILSIILMAGIVYNYERTIKKIAFK
jgi:O-antigen/teichoic acid export membrane protein